MILLAMATRVVAFIVPFALMVAPAVAACRSESFEGADYIVCSFDLTKTRLRTFWRDGQGEPYLRFSTLESDLAARGQKLAFAMNGGMYDDDHAPIGLYIEEGRQLAPANTKTVTGEPQDIPNFYKKPNGVFYIGDDEAGILETGLFLNVRPESAFATQSGPMLVIKGEIHPAFIVGSSFREQRNGVCVASPTEVHFAISEDAVNFYDFARFFRDKLGCDNALFLDGGSAPGLYAPELGRNDRPGHGGYGPIIAAVE
jgi:uncharacterized protein YigE (DUF2233 family)